MTKDVIGNYRLLVNNIGELINVSGYRNDYIAKKMGLKTANFSIKKQRGTWSVNEVEKLLSIIDNEDTENFLMLQFMRSKKDEETISLKEFKKEMGWK